MKFSDVSLLTIQQLVQQFQTSLEAGLSSTEAAERKKKFGANEVITEQDSWFKILVRQANSPFVILITIAAITSFLLEGGVSALIILVIVAAVIALGFYQEYGAFRTVSMLRNMILPQVHVIRDGKEQLIFTKELVPGDMVVVETGDVIPADMRFIKTHALLIDESALTGESAHVLKEAPELPKVPATPYEAHNIGFSGSTVFAGKGWGIVYATSSDTLVGNISSLAAHIDSSGAFQENIARVSRLIMYLAIATMIGIVFIHLFHKGLHQNIFQLILFALALGVGIVPEEFPLATTFALAQGAQKLGKNGMVAKRLSAIHDLGTVQVLCIDKTGTLTKNELSFKDVLSSDKEQALLFASLCASGWPSKGQPFINEIDKAVWSGLSEKNYEITKEYEKVFESPFETTQLKNIVIVRRGSQYLLLAKGAVEAVLALCTSENQESYSKYAVEEGKKGLRIIAIAFKEIKPQDDYTNVDLSNLHLAGIIALEDPIKETVVDVIKHAQELGVTIKIITGDAPEVTGAVAYQVGLVNSVDDVITGTVFAELDDNKKREVIDKQSAFARFTPEAKYAFVKMLQEKYEVGYLGDGINDAPALKVSNVSLVVEGSVGVAREVADIILLQKGLTVIIEGVQEGRKVFVNIIKYIKTTLSANIGIYYVVALASVFVDFLPMLPLQLLLVDLLGDSMRTAIATDNVDASEIQKPSIFSMQEITHMSLILALIGMAFYATIFILFYRIAPGVLQTNLFMACLISEILFILSIRSKKPFFKAVLPSLPLFIVLMTVAALVIGLPFVPFAEHYFGFVRPEMSHLMLIGVLEVVYFSVIEITKLIYYRINRTNNA